MNIAQYTRDLRARVRHRFGRPEDGAVDLASIMIGILILGIVAGIIAATVFGVIPWAQNMAARQNLQQVAQAEAIGQVKDGEFEDGPSLKTNGLLNAPSSVKVATDATGSCWVATSKSPTGKVFVASSRSNEPVELAQGVDTDCADLSYGSWSVPDAALRGGILSSLNLPSDHVLTLDDAAALNDSNDTAMKTAVSGKTVDYTGLSRAKGVTALSNVTTSSAAGLGNVTTMSSLKFSGATGPLTFPALTTLNGSLTVSSGDGVTGLSFPSATKLSNVTLNSAALASFSAPRAQSVGTLAFAAVGFARVDMNALTNAATIVAQANGLTAASFPALTTGSLSLSGNSLTSINVPSLSSAASINLGSSAMTSLSLPALSTVTGGLTVNGTAALTSLSADALTSAGSFQAGSSALATIELPNLQTLTSTTSSLSLIGNGLTSVKLQRLKTLAGTLTIGTSLPVTSLSLPAVTTVGGINATSTALATLTLPALQTVTGSASIACPALTSLSVPSLQQVGSTPSASLVITAPALTSLEATSLANVVGAFSLGDSSLTSLSIPSLATSGNVYIGNSSAATNHRLKSISFPALTSTGVLQADRLPALTTVDFPKLKSVTSIDFEQDPMLNLGANGFPALTSVSNIGSIVGFWFLDGSWNDTTEIPQSILNIINRIPPTD